MKTSKDFADLLACCNARGVEYLVVGGHAFAFHAKPRFTKDLDLLVRDSPENARRILSALDDFGFGGVGLVEEDFLGPEQIIQLGVAPNRVDLITSIDGVSFDDAWQGRAAGRYGAQPVFYLGLRELIRNKQAAGRAQDLADLEWLEREA
jgi:hypothetical protein